jgi:microcystin-dependent protein
MSQADLDIANISRSLVRAEINASLQALASCSSGASAPSTTYAYQLWADTSSGYLKQRNAANSAWITLFKLSTGGLAQLDGMDVTGAINEKRSTVAATATTTPLFAAGTGNIQDWTGTPTITDFPAAPQAGASRVVYPAAGTIFTDNANIDVQGDVNYTIVAGDRVEIEALTTTTFKVWIKRKNGRPIENYTGEIFDWPHASTPAYGLICNGAAVSRTTYAALFNKIGTTWGAGDGSTTFNVPNIQADFTTVQSSGNEGTSTNGQVIAHVHAIAFQSSAAGATFGSTAAGATSGTATDSTGGVANFAAAVRVRKCIRF